MTRYEIIEQNEEVLRLCAMAGVSVQDWQHAEIYRYVKKLRDDGHKMEYCVQCAVVRYVISPATVWRILRDMDEPVTINL